MVLAGQHAVKISQDWCYLHVVFEDRSPWGYVLPPSEKDEKHVSFREATGKTFGAKQKRERNIEKVQHVKQCGIRETILQVQVEGNTRR